MNKLTEKYTMWVARDKSGGLYQFIKKPVRKGLVFMPTYGGYYWGGLPNDLFDYITWENSPKRVEFTAPMQITLTRRMKCSLAYDTQPTDIFNNSKPTKTMNKLTEKYTMWVARDKGGDLWLYRNCPLKGSQLFVQAFGDYKYAHLPSDLFDYITWENSPQLVEFTATPVNLCK